MAVVVVVCIWCDSDVLSCGVVSMASADCACDFSDISSPDVEVYDLIDRGIGSDWFVLDALI